jgi:hypothetical protein
VIRDFCVCVFLIACSVARESSREKPYSMDIQHGGMVSLSLFPTPLPVSRFRDEVSRSAVVDDDLDFFVDCNMLLSNLPIMI